MSEQSTQPLAVIKVGGDILLDEKQKKGLADNITRLINQNWRVIVLHGGGPQVSSMQERVGLTPKKVAGRRITSLDDLEMVKQVICGQVNVDLVSSLQQHGVNAFGCHGASGKVIGATKRPPVAVSGGGSEPIDFGEVGDVVSIYSQVLNLLTAHSYVPVIASLGMSSEGRVFNINADTTVAEVATAMQADLLIFVTSVGGIFEDIKKPETRFVSLNTKSAKHYVDVGVIVDGMIPKVESALSLLIRGVGSVAIANTLDADTFISIAEGKNQFGTRIVR